MTVLVVAEVIDNALSLATRVTIGCAALWQEEIHVLVPGNKKQAESAVFCESITKVLFSNSEIQTAEGLSKLVLQLAEPYRAILAPANTFGKNFMPRVAAKLDVAQISDIIEVIDTQTFKRPIYAGNAIEVVKSLDAKQIVTVRPTVFPAVAVKGGSAKLEAVVGEYASVNSEVVAFNTGVKDEVDLTTAEVIVSGGRALGSVDNFELIRKLARKLNAAVGATRAAVDAGFISNDHQVGQTGKVVAPELYIAIGISGAIQHIAGIKDSKIIVAINNDPEAPIFDIADYGLVGDLFTIVPELLKLLN